MKRLILLLLPVLGMIGCHKDSVPPPPGAVVLSAPANNEVCLTGTIISNTQSTVSFLWNASTNTDSYQLVIKNLTDNTTISQSTTSTQAAVTLSRNTAFSWYINSISTNGTTKSDVWKFYNSGLAEVSHPPFPADTPSPSLGLRLHANNGTIDLSWVGSDPDNDIVSYDVFLGTTLTPPIFKSSVTDMFIKNVPVVNGIYYWRIVTKDSKGNTSDSGLLQFEIY